MNDIFALFFFYLNALWKRRWVVLLGAWAVAIPGWLVVAAMPSIYESSSRIYVDTSSVLQPLLRGIAVQSDLPTQVALMNQTLLSRPNLLEVARKTDYDLEATSESQMESLLESIKSRTTILSTRQQDIFSIVFQDSDPRRAYDVVQALLTIFVEGNLGQSRQDLDTAEEFIDRQIAEYEARLEDAEDRLARFKQDNLDVVMGEGGYLGRATAATNLVKQLEQDLSVALAQRDLLRQELAEIPETLPTDLANTGPPDDTEYRLVELEAQLRQLMSQYTEKHPDVISVRRQIEALLAKQAAAQAALAEQEAAAGLEAVGVMAGPASGPDGYGEPNPVYGEVKLRLIEIETQIENLRQRAAAARVEADALAAKAGQVPQIEAEFQKLNRDYDIVKARHDELLARRESARLSRSRDAVGQEVQYRLIDPPTVPTQPIGPNRPLFLNAVLAFAIAAGLGLGFVLVILDTSFSTVAELRAYTGISVLGAVSDTRKKLARRFAGMVALGSGFAALFVLLALLLLLERQFGLDTIVTADLGSGIFGESAGLIFNKVSNAAGWLR